ncbi:MAG: ATP-binding cassette domain-containing protein [Candidatus Andersenbacteria bacterium]
MDHQPSFVDLRHVYVDYQPQSSFLTSLFGRSPHPHSVLRDINLRLNQSDCVTVFGREGAGKTTLLRLLAGITAASKGTIHVNGVAPHKVKDLAAGYVSAEESEPAHESAFEVLQAFGTTHQITSLPARIGEISDLVQLNSVMHRSARLLSTAERLRLNLARAALSDAPLILLDDTADQLGVLPLKSLLPSLFPNRTIIVATRFVATAETLDWPMVLLHQATLAHLGTCNEIANALACPRILDVWIEGLRYDVLRKLRGHPGVIEVRLLPSSRFVGQRLRIIVQSARYLPSVYDIVSQTPLVRVQELPASLNDILSRL